MLLLWWCPFKIQKEKWAGLQFTSTDGMSLVSTPLRIRWTIPLKMHGTLIGCFPHVVGEVFYQIFYIVYNDVNIFYKSVQSCSGKSGAAPQVTAWCASTWRARPRSSPRICWGMRTGSSIFWKLPSEPKLLATYDWQLRRRTGFYSDPVFRIHKTSYGSGSLDPYLGFTD